MLPANVYAYAYGLMSENNASARAFYMSVHFFAVLCKKTTSNDKIIALRRKWSHDGEFSFLYLNLQVIRTNLPPGQSSHIRPPVKLNKLEQLQSSFK